ncbi:MAG: serine/threonine protein kinase [Longimicrobiales bacterium]
MTASYYGRAALGTHPLRNARSGFLIVKACPQCGSRFDDDGQYCPHDGSALRAISVPEIVTGTVIDGRYKVQRRLGSGGMGVVYLANDVGLDRLCALKVLRADLLTDVEAVARFHREAAEACKIIHSHVVTVYGFKETEEGLMYLAMEYVNGQTLAHRLADLGVLSPRPTARIVWQIANALGAAHELNIVHRDLKPGNIMLTRYREWNDFVKVVDFGLAKAFGGSTLPSITSHGHAIGTPAFMSPEQWLTADVDHRSDLYSLGLVTITMLAGGLPLDKPTAMISGPKILDELPVNDWPDELKVVLRRSLHLDHRQRFQSAREFATALIAAIDEWVPSDPDVREPWDPQIRPQRTPSAASPEILLRDGSKRAGEPPTTPHTMSATARGIRRWRYVAGALAAGIVIAAGFWQRSDRLSNALATNGSRQDSIAARVDDREQTSPSTTPAQAAPVPTIPSTEKRAGPDGTIDLPASMQRVEALLDLDTAGTDSVRLAIDIASTLLRGPLMDSARIVLTYRLAEGLLLLGDETTACSRLREIRPAAEAAGLFARSVGTLIDRHCIPE